MLVYVYTNTYNLNIVTPIIAYRPLEPIESSVHANSVFELLVREVQSTPKQQATAVTFGCFLELEGMSLFLKTPHTLDTGHAGLELECSLSKDQLSQYLRVLCNLSRQKSYPQSYPAAKYIKNCDQPNMTSSIVQQWHYIFGIINNILRGLKAHSI